MNPLFAQQQMLEQQLLKGNKLKSIGVAECKYFSRRNYGGAN